MLVDLKRIIEKLVRTFDFTHFYIHIFYFLLFFFSPLFLPVGDNYMLVVIGISFLLLKILVLWAYNRESLKKIAVLKKHKEFIALLILTFLLFSDLDYLFHNFGIISAVLFIILFIVGYFIGIE